MKRRRAFMREGITISTGNGRGWRVHPWMRGGWGMLRWFIRF